MFYECEKCQAPLGFGMRFCPQCGDKFPNPVPGDAAPKSDFQPQFAALKQTPQQSTKFSALWIGLGVVAILVALVLLGQKGGSQTNSATTGTTVSSMAPTTAAPTPAPPTAAQKHLAVVQARERLMAQKREARRAAREQAEQKRQAAKQAQLEQEVEERQAQAQRKDDEAYAVIKAKVQHDYPNDYITQKGVYDMAVQAYQYMKTLPDDEIKAKVESDYPDDYITQKGVYEMAAKAKQDMQ